MNRQRSLLIFIFVVSFFISCPAFATESRIVGGDGLVGDPAIASSVWRIGLCPVTAGQDYGFHVAETANSAWSGAFAISGAFKIVTIPDANPSTLTPDDIIRLGQEFEVDALLWGSVDQAKNQRSFWGGTTNPMHDVAVMITFKLFETQTGTLLWERILKKDRTVSASEADGIVERFTSNIVTDMVEHIIADGITGRDLSLNVAPVIETSLALLVFKTSAARLQGTVIDDFGINEVAISCGQDEIIGQWFTDMSPEFEFDVIVQRNDIVGDIFTIISTDSQGLETQYRLPVYIDSVAIEGLISSITADTIFINIGSDAGVECGMLFTIETSVEILDPSTGNLLGSSKLEIGKIEVVMVDAQFATCRLVEGSIGDINIGDRIY